MTPAEQRTTALATANKKRMRMTQIRKRINALGKQRGREDVADVFRSPDAAHSDIKAEYLLRSIQRFGDRDVGNIQKKAQMAVGRLSAQVGTLSERERRLIADYLLDPHLPAQSAPKNKVTFTDDELTLIRVACSRTAEKTYLREHRESLYAIAAKAAA